jgi:hypothetical protein
MYNLKGAAEVRSGLYRGAECSTQVLKTKVGRISKDNTARNLRKRFPGGITTRFFRKANEIRYHGALFLYRDLL